MQKLSNTKFLPVITLLLTLLLVAKIISLAVWWYLPNEGVELNAKKSYQAKYQRVDFKNMLIRVKVTQAPKTTEKTMPSYSINSLILKGLYGSRFHGYAIVAKKSQPKKTTIVAVGEVYAGYKLKEIQLTQVIFGKLGKDYILALATPKTKISKVMQRVAHTGSISNDTERVVTKNDIYYYSKNPSKIWKDIAIGPVKKRGKIVGFKVNRIKPGSKMALLGLQRGDIIIRANNVELTSFNDALNIYKNIDKIDAVEIVVLRNNQEKELTYEIR